MPIAKITQPDFAAAIAINPVDMRPMSVSMNMEGERVTELRNILFRAANTLDPAQTPEWVTNLLDVIDGVPT